MMNSMNHMKGIVLFGGNMVHTNKARADAVKRHRDSLMLVAHE